MHAKSRSNRSSAGVALAVREESSLFAGSVDGSAPALWAAAAQYLDRLSLEEKRAGGRVYTPSHLVTFILEQAGYHDAAGIPGASLLDPACGAGAFLVGAALAIAGRMRGIGADPQKKDRTGFLKAVESTLWGVDVDPHACELARASVARAVAHVSPGPIPDGFFSRNVVEADFLTAEADRLPGHPDGLAFIVGNPPYVSATRITSKYKAELRARYKTAGGRLDLYTVFLERSLTLLRPGGTLAMVTPDKYLVSHSGAALRSFIASTGAVRRIARFRTHKVFQDAATVPCVTVVERGQDPSPVAVMACADKPDRSGRVQVLHRSTLPPSSISSERWDLVPPRLLALARGIQAAHKTLADFAVRISAGPATGRDDLFVFPNKDAPEIEQELLRPVVRGRDLVPYGIKDPRMSILLPYTFDKRSGAGQLIDLSKFPKARKYLETHRRDLESRHCVRVWEKQWHDLHDQSLCDLARQPKLLVPDVANENRFAVDTGRYFPLHSAYYIVLKSGIDPQYIAGVLNSRVSRFLIRLLAPVVKDGFNRYRRQFLAVLPIPEPSQRARAELAAAARAGDSSLADVLATKLFALPAADLLELNRFLEDG